MKDNKVMDIKFKEGKDADYIKQSASMIEKTLEAFGIICRVVEVNILEKQYEYCLELAMGIGLDELAKHDRDLAMTLASPTGKVELQLPIPGRALVGLRIPKPSKEYIESFKLKGVTHIKENNLVNMLALPFYLIGEAGHYIARKIVELDKPKKQL